MKADNILFVSAISLMTACSSGQEDKKADVETHLDTSVTDSITTALPDTASTRTSSLSGSSGNGTLTDTTDVKEQKTGQQNSTESGTASTRTRSLSGSAGNGTLTDTADVNKQKAPPQKAQ